VDVVREAEAMGYVSSKPSSGNGGSKKKMGEETTGSGEVRQRTTAAAAQRRENNFREGRCFICDQFGHRQLDCPSVGRGDGGAAAPASGAAAGQQRPRGEASGGEAGMTSRSASASSDTRGGRVSLPGPGGQRWERDESGRLARSANAFGAADSDSGGMAKWGFEIVGDKGWQIVPLRRPQEPPPGGG
jgi:hypothetical protein